LKRIEPNLLLAISTTISLLLLLLTAVIYGEAGGAGEIKYPLMAAICVVGYVVANALMQRQMKRVTPPMIHADKPSTAAMAGVFPLIIMLLAAVPVFWSGHDYGLLVIIASVLTGGAIESAIKARSWQ
jgi:hypothetical protein